ncbi:MAG: hypothetical protein CBC47_07460 [Alphaproteobacteria bacterium TMED87]|nr:hypothetical protein [Rhodospirillaceae bacterium]OUV08450.1 MAG: hypothetical protein CBC47_07460 [Alphaproteobacteria bacterium TMED87]|tara:strand:+ start:495 stop:902 length:408 start_codon:yes stop_codon:yes gene_type:complete
MEQDKLLSESIDNIENAYEFMLAYAARGVQTEMENESPSIRDFLKSLSQTLGNINDIFTKVVRGLKPDSKEELFDFINILEEDARKAKSAVDLILSLPSISSQLVDNLNASIHLRALLTSIFVIDESISSLKQNK